MFDVVHIDTITRIQPVSRLQEPVGRSPRLQTAVMASTHPLIDAHCHLQDERIPAADVGAVLASARSAGVGHFVVNGCWQDDWECVIELAKQHPGEILPQLGLHPWWVGRRSQDWLERLRRLLLEHPTAGLGECGLDKGPKAEGSFADQLEAFEAQLRLAEELQRPVSIHCVRAFGAVHDALQRFRVTVPVVLHAWTGSAEMTTTLTQLPNVYFSLNGYLTKLPPPKALATIRAVPLERCLLESDAPDGALHLSEAWLEALPELEQVRGMAEESKHDSGNSPKVVLCTLRLVAAAMGRPEGEVAAATYQNAHKIFCSHLAQSGNG